MPFTCAVAECRNNNKTKEDRGKSLLFHRFPIKCPGQCSVWVTKCKRKELIKPKNSYICSDHFMEEDYERDMRNEMLGLPPRKMLKVNTVPSVFPDRPSAIVNNDRKIRVAKRRAKEMVCEILESTEGNLEVSQSDQEHYIPSTVDLPNEIENLKNHLKQKDEKIETMLNQLVTQRSQIIKLGCKIDRFRTRLRCQKLKLTRSVQEKKSNKNPKYREKKIRSKAVRKIFSPSQLKLMSGRQRVNWKTDDIVKALTLRSISLKAYETALDVWKLPLPAVRTLRDWIKHFKCPPGLITDVLQIMEQKASTMDQFSKLCVISFDEMSLDARFVLDPTFDSINSYSKAHVMKARGICSGWKQPFYYNFDTNMTKTILFEAIQALEAAGYLVWAIVSDLGGTNRNLWSELNISSSQVWFQNPSNKDRKVYVFSDIPHDMKNLRNHLIDDGLFLSDGTLIMKDTLETLLQNNGTELKLCPHLTSKLLEVTGAERMRVRPAVQLLSHHTATLAKSVFKENTQIAEFFEAVNNGFDVLNSRVPKDDKNSLKSGYGMAQKKQDGALDKLKEMLSTMCFLTKKGNIKKAYLPFQEGFIVSIIALQGLLEELKQRYGVTYILTSRLNQDSLESLFSVIRSFGGANINPTPPEFRYRLRLLLLGSRIRSPTGSNVKFDRDAVSYMSTELIKNNNLKTIVCSESLHESPRPASPAEGTTASATLESSINEDSVQNVGFGPTNQSLHYLAGYLAWKLKKQGKGVYGTPTAKSVPKSSCSWVQLLSRGGLLIPNEVMAASVLACENEFNNSFDLVKSGSNLTSKLVEIILNAHPNISLNIIKEFVKIRLHIKVKSLNEFRATNTMNKKKAKQFVKSWKSTAVQNIL